MCNFYTDQSQTDDFLQSFEMVESFALLEETYIRLRRGIVSSLRAGRLPLPEHLHLLCTDDTRPVFTRLEEAAKIPA